MGNRFTFDTTHLDDFDSAVEAWDHRVTFGQRGAQMSAVMNRFGRARGLAMYADWSERIAAGEVPPAPPRPQGVERNLVLTMWEWANETSYVHDEITTDKRQPTVNADGLVYGVSITQDTLVITDTARHRSTALDIPLRAPVETVPSFFPTATGVRAVAVLGRRDHLRRAGQPAQPDDGCARAGLDDLHHPRARQSRLVQDRLGAPLRAVLPRAEQPAPDLVLRPGDRVVHPDRQLLRHAPPAGSPRTRTTRSGSAATRTSSAGSTRSGSTRPATSGPRRAGVRP